jgi:hypothetical protein
MPLLYPAAGRKSLAGVCVNAGWVRLSKRQFLARLPPHWLSEIDLVLIGERAGSAADSTADQCAFNRSPNQETAYGTNAGADAGARDCTIRRARSARVQGEKRDGGYHDNGDEFHDMSPNEGAPNRTPTANAGGAYCFPIGASRPSRACTSMQARCSVCSIAAVVVTRANREASRSVALKW